MLIIYRAACLDPRLPCGILDRWILQIVNNIRQLILRKIFFLQLDRSNIYIHAEFINIDSLGMPFNTAAKLKSLT